MPNSTNKILFLEQLPKLRAKVRQLVTELVGI